MFFDEVEDEDVLFDGPITLLYDRIHVVEPFLATVMDIAEIASPWDLIEFEGDCPPIDLALDYTSHDLSKEG